jgi:predicted secreted hydrolase
LAVPLLILAPAANPARPERTPYRQALPGYRFRFPRDHAAHPDYPTEWWYYTGHLENGGRRFGYELTFFQVGIDRSLRRSRSAWALHTLYFAHFTVTDESGQRFHFHEDISRPALGLAGSMTDRYHVWVHEWSAGLLPDGKTHHLAAAAPDCAIDLDLLPLKPPVIHGSAGVLQKAEGAGHASHYYSLTSLRTSGTLTLNGRRLPVAGLSWMDHEFGGRQLSAGQAGWDWFSLQLEDQRELMLYLLRLKDGGVDPHSSGTLVNPDGTSKRLPLNAFRVAKNGTWRSAKTGALYPSGWSVRVPGEGVELRVAPTVPDQELLTEQTPVRYWEGSVRVQGKDQGRPVKGEGYVELTGYAGSAPGI